MQTRARDRADGGLLLTGATGFLGMELLHRYLERSDRRIYVLVRAPDTDAATKRMRSTVAGLFGDAHVHEDRLVAVPGDITARGLGLTPELAQSLAEDVSEIVHAAASVSFALPLDESRAINVEGTRRVLDLAHECDRAGGLRRFSYVSTAYVAGTHRGSFGEDDLHLGQSFRNAYERSKFETETLVRAERERLPIQIFRPSIIVGDRATGWTPSFNVLYWPLRVFARGAYSVIPARRVSPVDVVSVDYVADAIVELSGRAEGAGETYHLTAGRRAATVGQLLRLAGEYFGKPAPRLIPPSLYRRLVHPVMLRRSGATRRRALERSEVFFPYFGMRMAFDDERARARLEPSGIHVSPIEEYFPRLLDFAVEANWGARPVPRASATRSSGQDQVDVAELVPEVAVLQRSAV